VLEALLVRPDRLPPVIEVDEKPSVLSVDAARHQRLQRVASEGVPGLLGESRTSRGRSLWMTIVSGERARSSVPAWRR